MFQLDYSGFQQPLLYVGEGEIRGLQLVVTSLNPTHWIFTASEHRSDFCLFLQRQTQGHRFMFTGHMGQDGVYRERRSDLTLQAVSSVGRSLGMSSLWAERTCSASREV